MFIAAAMFLVPAAAFAQSSSAPGALELYPTIGAIGARLPYTGDDNGNATARLEWRAAGASAWTPGVAMTRITSRRWAGSVLWLEAATDYEVRAVIEDPDGGGGVTGSARTRDDSPGPATGRTWWVATQGNDAATGSESEPLRNIQTAVSRAQAGDEVRVRPGVYYESVDAARSGTPSSPIRLIADGAGVILDGSDPALLARDDWRDDGGGVFSVPFAAATRLVCADSLQRLYRQANLAALQAGANGVAQGWTIEGGRLYVRLEDGSSPSGHVMHVAKLDYGVFLDVTDWVVSGFQVRYYGTTSAASGIYLRAAHRCFVMSNDVFAIGGKGIYLRVLSSDNLLQWNTCRDPRISTWPWAATKAHEEEQQGISHRGGRGNVIRHNSIVGTFDGIDVAAGETDENVGADCDLEDNTISRVSDDGLEPETISGINVRVLRNHVNDVFSGMSISPSYQGPMYVLYNTLTNYRRGGFKFSLSGAGEVWICHNTLTSTQPGSPAVHPSGPYSNIHFRNNILVGNGAAAVSDDAGESETGNDFDGDLVWSNYPALFRWKNVNYATLAALQAATGFESHGQSGEPMLSPNFEPLLGSLAIDAALRLPGINDAFVGVGPDIGATELSIVSGDRTRPAPIIDLRVEP
jgi:hypothetical protein